MKRVAASYPSALFPVYSTCTCSIKSVFVKCTIHICLCLQSPVPHHNLDVTVEDVSQATTTVLVLMHAQMAVMKRDVVSIVEILA